ncbi:chemotaxis protein CheX [Niveibacterium sp. 24ML]|uniref:chemotaxis protein CheX n=1 Tax=Niveibacterium sp. 24ML TaxID=2985512 RepID=UPI0022709316|nr:chemotaxis protein CheX [Niveibacterium sp. 24ML]MCX9157260.1 chemotaxis protein CheX [Niveibacterium sp. 24ML]
MDEQQLRVFIDIVSQYFEKQTGKAPDVGSPYLGDASSLPIYDFTGVIGISGERQGCVYVTAHRDLLRQLLLHVGESDVSDNNLSDLVGEVANTISGNARRYFGPDFMISVPVVVSGNARAIQVPRSVKAYILPLRWHKFEAALVVSLQ